MNPASPFDIEHNICDHASEVGERDCFTSPTNVIVVASVATGMCVYSASCARHIGENVDEARELSKLISLPHTINNYIVNDDRFIRRAWGWPVDFDRFTLDEV